MSQPDPDEDAKLKAAAVRSLEEGLARQARPARSYQIQQVTERLIDLWHGADLGRLTSEDLQWIVFALGMASEGSAQIEREEAARRKARA